MSATIRNAAILLVLLFAAGKLYLWHRVDSAFEAIAKLLNPVGTLTFDGAYGALNGDLGVRHFEFAARGGGSRVYADELIIHTPGLGFLFGLKSRLSRGEVPETLGLSLNGVESNVLAVADRGRDTLRPNVSGDPFEALACGEAAYFGIGDLAEMGILDPRTNLHFDYLLGVGATEVAINISAHTNQVSRINLEVNLVGSSKLTEAEPAAWSNLRLRDVSYKHQDLEFNSLRNNYCAALLNVDHTTYTTRQVDAVLSWLAQRGYRPTDEVVGAYKSLQNPNAELLLTATPSRTLALAKLAQVRGKEWLQLFNIRLSVNGARSIPFEMQRIAKPKSEQPAKQGRTFQKKYVDPLARARAEKGLNANHKPVQSTIINQPKKVANSAQEEILMADLSKYLGERIKVYTATGQTHQGVLDQIRELSVVLTIYRGTGHATYPIAKSRIRRIEAAAAPR